MKKRLSIIATTGLIAVAATLLAAQPAAAVGIDIQDPMLKGCINSGLHQQRDAEISDAQAQTVTDIDCKSSGVINSLNGLEKFTNLQSFKVGAYTWGRENSQITDLSPLSGLTQLQDLHVDYTMVSDVSVLAGLTNLKTLTLFDNKIRDARPIAALPNLSSLQIGLNYITDFSVLKPLTSRKIKIDASMQLGTLPAIGVGESQLNPVKGINSELPRVNPNDSNDQNTIIDPSGSSWHFTKARTANGIIMDFPDLRRSGIDIVVFLQQDSLATPSTVEDDGVSLKYKGNVLVDVLANDGKNNESPLVPGSLTLLNAKGQSVKSLSVAGGTFQVVNNKIRFTAIAGRHGKVTPVSYQVTNQDGIASRANILVAVEAPAVVPGGGVTTPTTPITSKPIVTPTRPTVSNAGEMAEKPILEAAGSQESALANTGSNPVLPLSLGGLLLLAGTAVTFFSRNKKAGQKA